jgi:hypothetical protein
MNNVTYETVTNFMTGDEVEYVTIDHGNEQFTSMTKEAYEAQLAQAEHFTPIVSSDAD